jgi:hypothetical protein
VVSGVPPQLSLNRLKVIHYIIPPVFLCEEVVAVSITVYAEKIAKQYKNATLFKVQQGLF